MAQDSCTTHQEKLEKSNGRERMKYSLDNAREKVKIFGSLCDQIKQEYELLLHNYPSRDFVTHELSSAVQIEGLTSEENYPKLRCNELATEIQPDSQSEDLIKRYEKLLQDNFTKELRGCDYEEKKRLELQLQEANDQCRHLKTELQAANEELTKTNELLIAERMLCSKVEIERDSLARLVEKLELIFLKYDLHYSSADETVTIGALPNEKLTTELDMMVEYEPDTVSSPKHGCPSSQKEPLLNANISVATPSLFRKINSSMEQPRLECDYENSESSVQCEENVQLIIAEKMERSISAESAARNQPAYNTPGNNEKSKLIKGNLPKKPKVRCEPIINNSLSYQKDSSHRCDICGMYYSSKNSLTQHKRTVHGGVKAHSHKCKECNKTFARKARLSVHYSVHSSERPFQCSFCNRSFKTAYTMNQHRSIIHGDAGFYCAHCNGKFRSKRDLIHHITARHLPELGKPYKCTTCGKSFVQKGHLNTHQAVHISERTHKCSMCEKSFKTRRYKLKHERRTHMEGFRFTCAHCEREFRHKASLKNHIQRLHL